MAFFKGQVDETQVIGVTLRRMLIRTVKEIDKVVGALCLVARANQHAFTGISPHRSFSKSNDRCFAIVDIEAA